MPRYYVEVFEADAEDANGEVLHEFVHFSAVKLKPNDLIRADRLGTDAARIQSIFESDERPGAFIAYCTLSPYNG